MPFDDADVLRLIADEEIIYIKRTFDTRRYRLDHAVPSIVPWSTAPAACQQQCHARAKKRAEKTSVVDITAIGDHQTSSVGAELETDYDTKKTMETDTEDIKETEFLHKCT